MTELEERNSDRVIRPEVILKLLTPYPHPTSTPPPVGWVPNHVTHPVGFHEPHVDVEVVRAEDGEHKGGHHGEEAAHGQKHAAHPQEKGHSARLFTRHKGHHQTR